MSLTPTIYSSDDPGAPQLSGTVGSLISVLRAVLVGGYGSKDAAGWTEEFVGSDPYKAVFRNSPITSSGYCTRVLDDGTAAAGGSARSATMRAFESMTDVDTGLGPTPTVSQMSNGYLWAKSQTANATNRSWFAFANDRWVYLFVAVGGTGSPDDVPYFMGDIDSMMFGDDHCYLLSGTSSTAYTGSGANYSLSKLLSFISASNSGGRWGAAVRDVDASGSFGRSFSLAPGSVYCRGQAPTNAGGGGGGYGSSQCVGDYPSPVTGGVMFEYALVRESSEPRGFMPGVFVPLHASGMGNKAVVPDVDGMAPGTSFMFKTFSSDSTVPGAIILNLGSVK